MSKKILIAYGSRYGSTEEISINFKETLEEKGFFVDLINLRSKNSKKPDIANYSGVLIGSGIRIARWTKEAKNFLKANVNHINENETLVGIFLSSGEASDPETRPDAVDKYLVTIFKELGLDLGNHVLYDAFGGVFDLSATTKLSWINRKMMTMAAKDEPNIEANKRNDLRDWDQIKKFMEDFASRIQ